MTLQAAHDFYNIVLSVDHFKISGAMTKTHSFKIVRLLHLRFGLILSVSWH